MNARWLAAAALALPVPAAAADAIQIQHQSVECVSRDRYPRIAARGAPAERVVAAELQFRVTADGAWYSVLMTAAGGEWSALLPRPIGLLDRFEYRVVMKATDLEVASTAPFAVRVGDDCGEKPSSSAVAAPIVVRVPAGAPLVPPVPAGFSPAGVVAAEEIRPKSSSTKKWLALGGVAGAVGAAAVAAGSSARPEVSTPPLFEFFGTSPTPGAALSLGRDQFGLTMRVSGGDRVTLDLLWRIDLLRSGGGPACVIVADRSSVGPGRPQVVTLTSRFMVTGVCTAPFDVESAHVSILLEGDSVYDQIHVLPFHFVP